jgi:hypothetical protein
MRVWILGALLIVGTGSLALETSSAQDKKKEQPKKKTILTFTDEKEAGPDFAIQGEYVGDYEDGGKKLPLGVQVIAAGDGTFRVKYFPGGLPGAGWDGNPKTTSTTDALTEAGKTRLRSNELLSGDISNGILTGRFLDKPCRLKRVVRQSPTLGAKPPQGAVVLFDGSNVDHWTRGKLAEGKYLDTQKTGNVISKPAFKDFKLHMEFRTPFMPNATGQARGNSGVYLQDRYELQVLDSFGLKGVNNECGGFYQQADPKVNMCFPPLSWQTYDIDFKAARFDAGGQKTANAVVTVRHNGVVIQDNLELKKETPGGKKETDTPGPIHLQDHGNPVYYRNIWVVETK